MFASSVYSDAYMQLSNQFYKSAPILMQIISTEVNALLQTKVFSFLY